MTYSETDVQCRPAEVINIVNNFFYDRLIALPPIKHYMDRFIA